MSAQPGLLRLRSVSTDWRTPLSVEKSEAYQHSVHRLETSYTMFSVNLDEAIGLHRCGRLQKSCQILTLSPDLCTHFALLLTGLLRAMLAHSKHFGIVPNLAPLDADNFLISRSRRLALFNGLFSRVLLTRKMQFLHKLSTLAELVEDLNGLFRSAAENLAKGVSIDLGRDWEALDAAHYDLNTSLREAVVIFKCFLHALPEGQLAQFRAPLFQQLAPTLIASAPRLRQVAGGRLTLIKGQ